MKVSLTRLRRRGDVRRTKSCAPFTERRGRGVGAVKAEPRGVSLGTFIIYQLGVTLRTSVTAGNEQNILLIWIFLKSVFLLGDRSSAKC